MRTAILLLLIASLRTGCRAQEFGTRWLSCPHPDTTEAVWFRQTYLPARRPLYTHIAVATTGRIELYVNGANAGGNNLLPARAEDDGRPVTLSFDISRYTGGDSLTIAILYAPAGTPHNGRQIAACLYGRRRDGTPFARYADGDWLCRPAGIRINSTGAESHDGRQTLADEPYRHACATACWLSPTLLPAADTPSPYPRSGQAMTGALRPRYFDIEDNRVSYEFGTGFFGFVRLTLRGAQPGERIRIGDTEYVCSGQTDEQACARFAPAYLRRVTVEGDERFSPSQIERVEGLSVADTIIPLRVP